MLIFKCGVCGKQWDDARMKRDNAGYNNTIVVYSDDKQIKVADQNCFECTEKIEAQVTEAREKAEEEAREKAIAEIQAAI